MVETKMVLRFVVDSLIQPIFSQTVTVLRTK